MARPFFIWASHRFIPSLNPDQYPERIDSYYEKRQWPRRIRLLHGGNQMKTPQKWLAVADIAVAVVSSQASLAGAPSATAHAPGHAPPAWREWH